MGDAHRLKYHRIWVIIGIGLVLLLILLSLVPSPPKPMDFKGSDKFGHLSGYAIIMGWFMQIYRDRVVRALVAVSLAMLGFVLEVLQGLSGIRHFDYMDAAANATGVLVAWWLVRPPFSELLRSFERQFAT